MRLIRFSKVGASLVVLAFAVCLLVSCGQEGQQSKAKPRLPEFEGRPAPPGFVPDPVGTPAEQIENLKAELKAHREMLNMLNRLMAGEEPADIDVTTKQFTPVHTGYGVLLISCAGAEPYLNGYKLKLRIGNPLHVQFNGFGLKCQYGLKEPDIRLVLQDPLQKVQDYDAAMEKHKKSLRSTEVSFADALEPGTWHQVELILVPSTAAELGCVRVSMKFETVSLRDADKK